MALTLSTLTSPTTSGDVLSELTTKADFLDSVPVLKNVARGPNKGGDATQTTGLNQPKALPLDPNGKGYCYLPVTTGNAPAVTFPTIGASDDFVLEMDVYLVNSDEFHLVTGANANNRFAINYSFNTHFFDGYTQIPLTQLSSGLSTLTIERSSGLLQLKQNGVVKSSLSSHTRSYDFNHLSFNGQFSTGLPPLNGYIQKATLSIEGTEELNIDFNATSIPHGAKKFQCATNQVVTINQSGNDPATVIKKSVLRFSDAANTGLQGLLGQTITEGYMFAAFSVLGDGGDSYARLFIINPTGGTDAGHFLGFRLDATNTFRSDTGGSGLNYSNMYDDERGDVLYEYKFKSGDTRMRFNNATGLTNSSWIVSSSAQEFSIAASEIVGDNNAAIDLEFLALFPATLSDAEAARVVSWVNRRSIFDLKDGFGHYFYDGTKAPVGNITDVATWNGRIVGSDNGDVDKLGSQPTNTAQPVGDGYKVTFATTDFVTIPSTTQSGWQVVGTSLGTFAYRVNANAVTELNLLGNLGSASFRKAGQSYGMLLLPETANGKEIESARQLLIDRGAADGTTASSLYTYWYNRTDIVEFKSVDTSSVTDMSYAWYGSSLTSFPFIDTSSVTTFSVAWLGSSLTSFPALDMSSGNNFVTAWKNCSALTSFPALDMSSGANFTSAWQNCTALTSFPAGAKLGTAAENVNFASAWRASGLTSFPANIDLSNGTNFNNAWRQSSLNSFPAIESTQNGTSFSDAWYTCTSLVTFGNANLSSGTSFTSAWHGCSALTDFSGEAKLGTAAENVNFTSAWRASGLTALPAGLDLSKGDRFNNAFNGCTALTTIGSGVLLGTAELDVSFTDTFINCTALTALPASLDLSSGVNFTSAFQNCTSLVDFPAGAFNALLAVTSNCFNATWDGCSALNSDSVFNILSSIDTSTQSAPSTGPQITIDYDGTTLSAATNTAVTSLKSKGWVIVVNGTTL